MTAGAPGSSMRAGAPNHTLDYFLRRELLHAVRLIV